MSDVSHPPGLDFHVERLLEQRLGHVSAQRGADLGVAGGVLHHVRHPLLPSQSDRVGVPGPGNKSRSPKINRGARYCVGF